MKKLPTRRRQAVSLSPEGLIRTELLHPGKTLPLVIKPAADEVSLIAWAAAHREWIEAQVLNHGALLFRGFPMETAAAFEQFVRTVSGELMAYRERSSPRSAVSERVYTSTDYPPDQRIFPHNEHSYAMTFPLRLFFFCLTPAEQGGETLLGDCRNVFRRIHPNIRDRFIRTGWMYVRNFGDGFGLPWQTVFQTTDKAVVEAYCREQEIGFDWKDDHRLRTRQVRPAVARHPRTGEWVWFNHATFFHVSTLEPTMRAALVAEFEEEDLPNNTYYGDGSPLESSVLDALRQAYQQEMVPVAWQKGDIIMLDNMLTAHARAPYRGPRKILFAMAEPVTRQQVSPP